MTNIREPIYRVLFAQDDKYYEVYARYISEEHLMGFIQIEDILFDDAKSGVVIDPSEEKLRLEFKGVKRCYVPMHSILRIDEVEQQGTACIKDINTAGSNVVSAFPKSTPQKPSSKDTL